MDRALAAVGFTPAEKAVRKRLILSVEGLPGSGKTHFSLTAPDPIAYFGLDVGDEGVVGRFLDAGKEILIAPRDIRVPAVLELADEKAVVDMGDVWDKCRAAFLTSCRSPHIKTIVWDTATEIWELIRLVRFGRLAQVKPHHYAPVNAEMRGLLRAANDSNKNFILIHKLKDEYVNEKRTGKKERAGFSDIEYVVQAQIRVAYDVDDKEFWCRVIKSRLNMTLVGEELWGEPMCSFPYLAASVFPETELSEWE